MMSGSNGAVKTPAGIKRLLTSCLQTHFLEKLYRYFTKGTYVWYKVIMDINGNAKREAKNRSIERKTESI